MNLARQGDGGSLISVVNCGIGNIGSVVNMLKHIGAEPVLASTVEEIETASALLLPGVGHYGRAMETLHGLGFVEPLRRRVLADRVPILGICLGMQLLGNGSEEGGSTGLGLIDADFVRIDTPANSGLKVPHMGWNTIAVKRENPLLDTESVEERFYFVHSYYAKCNVAEDVVATCDYGGEFTCVYGKNNIYGTQFHPEKSHRFGMKLLKQFVGFAC